MSARVEVTPTPTPRQTAANLLAYPHDKPLVHVDRPRLALERVRAAAPPRRETRNKCSIDCFWLLDRMDVDDNGLPVPKETADMRLARLLSWATVDQHGRAVDGHPRPSYADFNYPSKTRDTLPTAALKVRNMRNRKGNGFEMANILIMCNAEISVKRYQKYKQMILDSEIESKRLAKLYGLNPDDPPRKPNEIEPEQARYYALQKRIKALKDVIREAMRRLISIHMLFGDYDYVKTSVAHDDVDQEHYDEIMRRQDRRYAENDSQMDDPIVEFDPAKQLNEVVVVLEDILTNYTGNDLLKDFIYADVVAFFSDGAAAMDVYRNYVFMGPSGVGKTTWARLMGRLYRALGIYMYGTVVEASAGDFVATYLGQSAPKTQGMLDSNLENIVLIDEAYAITDQGKSTAGSSYGAEVISTLVNYMDKNRGCIMIIIAGYEDKMKKDFLAANEGLDRRFPNKFVFPSYTSDQLVHVLKKMLEQRGILDKWGEPAFARLQILIQECLNSHKLKNDPMHAGLEGAESAPIYEELFSKQGGSMENLANQMVIYSALPDKRPAHRNDTKYNYKDDMIAVLASMLDRKWHAGLNDPRALIHRKLYMPTHASLPDPEVG